MSDKEKFTLKNTGNSQSDTSDLKSEMKAFESGLVFGFGYQFAFGLAVVMSYGLGMANIRDLQNHNMKNRVILIDFLWILSRFFSH